MPSPQPSAAPAAAPLFQCTSCQRAFTRIDHLSRHVRIHTLEKPYNCEFCDKKFSRVDLLKRHACRHAPYINGDPKAAKSHARVASRVGQACKACAASKIKCTDDKPCRRCASKNIICEVDCPEELEQSPGQDAIILALQDLSQHIPDGPIMEPFDVPHADIGTQLATGSEIDISRAITYPAGTDPVDFTSSLDSHSTVSGGFVVPATPTLDLNTAETSELYADFLKNLLDNTSSTTLYPPPMHADDFGISFWDDYLDVNMSLGHTTDGQTVSPQIYDAQSTTQPGPRDANEDTNTIEQKAFRAAANAFEQSGWNWSPSSQNHRSAEHGGLSLPHDWTRHEGLPQPDADFSAKRMRPTDRERVMGLLVTYCSKQHLARMVSTFPSVSSLDGLVHRFLRSQTTGHEPWIHIPTLDPTLVRPEFLAAVIAHGACSSSVEVITKLGYAMIDIVRTAVIDNWHGDNSLSRDIQLLQALLLILNLAMWSGNKCMMEIAESTMGPSITIIRRAGWLREESYPTIEPHETDQGFQLHQKWISWVQQESRKRLCYQTFLFDAQVSMTRMTSPTMSFSEMTLPYPDRSDVWSAVNAESWKARYLERPDNKQKRLGISLADDTRTMLNEGNDRSDGDAAWRNTTLLHGIWRLIWGHREIDDLLQATSPDGAETSSLLVSRGEGLAKLLNKLRLELGNSSTRALESVNEDMILIQEFLNMVLHAPVQSLQAFAGKDGVATAQRVYPVLEEWTQSKSARRAVCHAGQLIRVARTIQKGRLCDWRVVIVYHASLVFWAYGIICSIRQNRDATADHSASHVKNPVCLDQEHDGGTRRYINLGDGEPCLLESIAPRNNDGDSVEASAVPLRKASKIMQTLARILVDQAAVKERRCVPLSESFARLMNELARSAKAIGLD